MSFGHIMGHTVGNAIVHGTLALAVLATTSGCDIVQGFQNAGDALFPPQKTYLETPGFRLATGGFRRGFRACILRWSELKRLFLHGKTLPALSNCFPEPPPANA